MPQADSAKHENLWRESLRSNAVPLIGTIFLVAVLSFAPLYNLFVGCTLFAVLAFFALTKPSWRESLLVLVLAAVLTPLKLAPANERAFRFLTIGSVYMSFAGMTALFLMALKLLRAKAEARSELARVQNICVLLVLLALAPGPFLPLLAHLTPRTLDLYLYVFDASLGTQLSFVLGQWAFSSYVLRFVIIGAYYSVTAPILGLAALQLARNSHQFPKMVNAFALAEILGVLCYQLFPAAGPRPFVGLNYPGHFIAHALAKNVKLEAVALPFEIPRNAMPSLHMTFALLVFYNSRRLGRWIRAVALVYVLLTILSTLGTGEHYVADLVAAFPFSVSVQAICSSESWASMRWGAAALSSLLTLLWMTLLRFETSLFFPSPLIPWSLAGAFMILSVLLETRLSTVGEEHEILLPPASGEKLASAASTE